MKQIGQGTWKLRKRSKLENKIQNFGKFWVLSSIMNRVTLKTPSWMKEWSKSDNKCGSSKTESRNCLRSSHDLRERISLKNKTRRKKQKKKKAFLDSTGTASLGRAVKTYENRSCGSSTVLQYYWALLLLSFFLRCPMTGLSLRSDILMYTDLLPMTL